MKYDVVIVGGGAAGCVLAARLSEDRSRQVLLIEAGRDFPGGVDELPPSLLEEAAGLPEPDYAWIYEGIADRELKRPLQVWRGRVIGGSGSVNSSLYNRGRPEDYGWGGELWEHDAIVPYFRDTDLDPEAEVPVTRTPVEEWPAHQQAFREAALDLGFAAKQDMMEPAGTGISAMPRNAENGVRLSTAITHLAGARERPNLTVRAETTVWRVLFDGTRAVGVELVEDEVVEAGEVILAAGAIATPQLLTLSGVGPGEVLERLGIPAVRTLAGVGRNLSDHPVVMIHAEGPPPPEVDSRIHSILTYTSEAAGGDRNDINLQIYDTLLPDAEGALHPQLMVVSVLETPDSRGQIEVLSSDPAVLPRVDFNYLDSPRDRERLREALRVSARVVDHEAFATLGFRRLAPTDEQLASDAELDRFVRELLFTAFHGCGTCRIGPASDPDAVVDERGLVHGLTGLRVADLSIVPAVPGVAPYATAVMVGERIAQLCDRRAQDPVGAG